MLDNRACPLCGGHLDWMKVGARELYRCGSCVRQMTEQEVLDYRRELTEVAGHEGNQSVAAVGAALCPR